jgi:hypothetical protein
VAFVCAYNTLVYNPEGLLNFFESAKNAALGGRVYESIVDDLAIELDANGKSKQAGFFLHVELFLSV